MTSTSVPSGVKMAPKVSELLKTASKLRADPAREQVDERPLGLGERSVSRGVAAEADDAVSRIDFHWILIERSID